MKKFILGASVLAASLSFSANAELMEANLKENNDGLVTLDTNTGLEWLDITLTMGMSVNQVLNDDRFSGWRVATKEESDNFVVHYRNLSQGYNLMSLVGQYGNSYSYGLYHLHTSYYSMSGAYNNVSGYNQYGTFNADYSRADFGVWLVSDGGLSLSSINNPNINSVGFNGEINDDVNASVPLSGSLSILALSLAGLVRRKTKK